jgi:hypothetical protein
MNLKTCLVILNVIVWVGQLDFPIKYGTCGRAFNADL